MNLGQFSISLAVQDLEKSKPFYEALGFSAFADSIDENYVIMKQGDSLIGLFHGMFDQNIMTFNPGWDANAQNVDPFDDVRDIQNTMIEKGIDIDIQQADVDGDGPAHVILHDPDGNVIMIDQHR